MFLFGLTEKPVQLTPPCKPFIMTSPPSFGGLNAPKSKWPSSIFVLFNLIVLEFKSSIPILSFCSGAGLSIFTW